MIIIEDQCINDKDENVGSIEIIDGIKCLVPGGDPLNIDDLKKIINELEK